MDETVNTWIKHGCNMTHLELFDVECTCMFSDEYGYLQQCNHSMYIVFQAGITIYNMFHHYFIKLSPLKSIWWFPESYGHHQSSYFLDGIVPYKPSILGYPHDY